MALARRLRPLAVVAAGLCAAALLAAMVAGAAGAAADPAVDTEAAALRAAFAAEVASRLDVPVPDLGIETALLEAGLAKTGTVLAEPEVVILVDRSPHVQAASSKVASASRPP